MKVSRQKRYFWWLVIVAFGSITIGVLLMPIAKRLLPNLFAQSTVASTSSNNDNEALIEARSYELLLQQEPDNATAWERLLEIRLQQQDLNGAITALDQLAQLRSDQLDYQVLLAQAQQQVGEYEQAAATYRSLLTRYPTHLSALQGMVNLLLHRKRPLAAIGLLEETLETMVQASAQEQPAEIMPIQLLLGQVYASQGQNAKAIAVYNRAIAVDAEDFRPVLAKALILQEQGKISESQSLLSAAITLAPARYRDQIKSISTASISESTSSTATNP